MVNPRLKTVCQYVDSWCQQRDVNYGLVCDESDLQGVLLFKKDRQLVQQLLENLATVLENEGVHLETTKVRGGTILVFSIKAISESMMAALIAEAGEEVEPMNFTDKISDAFSRTTANDRVPVNEDDFNEGSFLNAALKIVDESQFKSPTSAIGHNTLERNSYRPNKPGKPPGKPGKPISTDEPQATTGASQPAKGPAPRFENRITNILGGEIPSRMRQNFGKHLNETLAGMATPSGAQPGDLFTKFARALAVLGQNMGTGPLQDQLKKQGINWKKSDDGQSIILYIVNASTNAPQPIARISAATLEKPSDFEKQLLHIMDFAKGDAPGTFEQKQEELKMQQSAAREIAKQLAHKTHQPWPSKWVVWAEWPRRNGPRRDGPRPTTASYRRCRAGIQGGNAGQPAPQAAAQQAAMPKPGI
jgi:hypothetical protein